MNDELEESVLVLRCRIGDREALGQLIDRYYRRLRYFIGRLADGPEAVDDVLQETWLRAIAKLGTLRNAESFKPWLYRIARNEAYQHLRRKGAACEVHDERDVPDEGRDEAFSAADAARIHNGLGCLHPAHREILVLRFFEDMAYQQIAEVLGCGLNTVKTRLFYAKRALKKEMEANHGNEHRSER
ncbi:MAG TPA: RNA polymerase sigma factor [Candidatus Bathyarchaeia archaeon]|nr:RNA polymerase sigma factor [Candidatus Bathyarchaeia archaeon]